MVSTHVRHWPGRVGSNPDGPLPRGTIGHPAASSAPPLNRHQFIAGTAPGPAAAAGLPADMRVAYYRPSPAFGQAITGYNSYGALDGSPRVDLFLPAPAMLCINVDAGPMEVVIGRRRFTGLARASLYGATTYPIEVHSQGGINIGIGISPIGWARLTRRSAAGFLNQVVPLAGLFGPELGERLCHRLDALEDVASVGAVLDDELRPLLADPHPDEPLIERVAALLLEEELVEIGAAAERVGIPGHTLRRLTARYFGLTPKLLARRARFLRAFLRLASGDEATTGAAIERDYYDASHFLRDAQSFLGATPRRFLARATPILHASLIARAAVLGVSAQALHGPAAHTRELA